MFLTRNLSINALHNAEYQLKNSIITQTAGGARNPGTWVTDIIWQEEFSGG